MFDSPPQQPQSLGDLLGRAFRIYRRNIPLFFKVLLGPTVVSAVGALGLQWAATYGLTQTMLSSVLLLATLVTVSLIILLGADWILVLRQLAFVRMANGFAQDYTSAYAYMNQRKWQVLVLSLMSGLIMICAMLAWILALILVVMLPKTTPTFQVLSLGGAILGVVGFAGSTALILVISCLAFSILACEQRSVWELIGRGWDLIFSDLWRSLAFSLLLLLAVTAISYPLSLPVMILTIIDMCRHGLAAETLRESYTMPLYLMVINQVWESLIHMLLWPVIFLAYGLFYYDLRLRQEGLDVLQRLEGLERQRANKCL
ncbi:MAG: hypothetical protein HY711_01145 [Candidatus Melainabacteria bacterium]|nr:hypothetical protein [Candidatus Melainabacteria bacterium]